jgi:hypothetical protein
MYLAGLLYVTKHPAVRVILRFVVARIVEADLEWKWMENVWPNYR